MQERFQRGNHPGGFNCMQDLIGGAGAKERRERIG